jgi:serine/threonine-protein kinase RsbW
MFDISPQHDGFTVTMATDLNNVDRSVDLIRAFLEERGAQEHFFALSLLAREALNNAMIHGNRLERSRAVCLRFQGCDGGFDLEVEDQGAGFDWKRHVQASSGVEDVRGRGHEIYRNYARTVRYNERGNILTLEYRGEQC